jgi:hypothetical protein
MNPWRDMIAALLEFPVGIGRDHHSSGYAARRQRVVGLPIGDPHVNSRRSAFLTMKADASASSLGEFRFDARFSSIDLEKVVLLA